MIPRVHPRGDDATQALAEALGRPISHLKGLTAHAVAAHWPDLDFLAPAQERTSWTYAGWAELLNEPNLQHHPAGPHDGHHAIWHSDIRLHHSDRILTRPEWSETAHRLARAAGIHTPGGIHNCRWIAVQAQPGRLGLIANLIRPDHTWTRQPPQVGRALNDQCRSIERDLALISPLPHPDQAHTARLATRSTTARHEDPAGSAETAAETGRLIRTLADENGPLADVRHLVEHAAHRLDGPRGFDGPAAGHRLEWIARRVHGIQEDLRGIADTIPNSANEFRRAAAAPPLAHRATRALHTPRLVR
ncbi:hypothetical protein SAMN05216267_103930 [Actinacidiphila rubida]|uniref:Relaxase/mobilization nuclease n=1 Tax=Actinacidiphila rubida TaxID=310780 RepID=A0A1H8S555_9ACTN|nr:hypothetical protein [Actinacidiphila rubida]SEO73544.1 hypothetical protein SAMN05216267_103930 [Actinacidiphila rubida]